MGVETRGGGGGGVESRFQSSGHVLQDLESEKREAFVNLCIPYLQINQPHSTAVEIV